MYRYPHECPICGDKLTVTEVSCDHCGTHIQGRFDGCRFCRLSSEESAFLLTFIKCRGSIKDVERELGVSYPTVRSMLDRLILSLDREAAEPQTSAEILTPPLSAITTQTAACATAEAVPAKKQTAVDARRIILDQLAAHEITAEEASALLKKL